MSTVMEIEILASRGRVRAVAVMKMMLAKAAQATWSSCVPMQSQASNTNGKVQNMTMMTIAMKPGAEEDAGSSSSNISVSMKMTMMTMRRKMMMTGTAITEMMMRMETWAAMRRTKMRKDGVNPGKK